MPSEKPHPPQEELDKGWADGSHPGWEDAGPEISDADLEHNLVPVEDQVMEHINSQSNSISTPAPPKPMPEKSLIQKFFGL